MMKKTHKLILVGLTTLFIGINTAECVSLIEQRDNTEVISTKPKEVEVELGEEESKNGNIITNKTYTCSFTYYTDQNRNFSIDAYDEQGTSLIPVSKNFKVQNPNFSLLAGTSIGLKIVDNQQIWWQVPKDKIIVTEKTIKTEVSRTKIEPGKCACKMRDRTNHNKGCDDYFAENVSSSSNCDRQCFMQTQGEDCEYTGNFNYIPQQTIRLDDAVLEEKTKEIKFDNTPKSNSNNDYNKLKQCAEKAINAAIMEMNGDLGWKQGAYTIYFTDSNDINKDNYIIDRDEVQEKECYRKDNDGKEIADDPLLNGCSYNLVRVGDEDSVTRGVLNYYINKFLEPGAEKINENIMTDKIFARLEYKKEKTCINAKTGEVSYVPTYSASGTKEKCDDDEFTIENDEENGHWHYFVPLNAKGNENASQKVLINFNMNWQGTLTKKECQDIMKNHANTPTGEATNPYTNWISIYNGKNQNITSFDGDFWCKSSGDCNESGSKDWRIIDNKGDDEPACKYTTTIEIPIKQAFYNEVVSTDSSGKETSKLQGFNFYYKPIDPSNENQISTIFPNIVATEDVDTNGNLKFNTLWSDWYKAQTNTIVNEEKKKPDLTESYDVVTYYTTDINANKIRKYNKDNVYTSWKKMNLDGTSRYIDLEGVIERNIANTGNIYKLGCGPLNTYQYLKNDDGTDKIDSTTREKIKNPLYREECKVS